MEITWRFGASNATTGTVSDASISVSVAFRPRKRYFASAYPPIELKNIDIIVPADARKTELAMCRQNVTGPCGVACGWKSVRKLSRLIVSPEIFAAGGRNVYSFKTLLSLNAAQTSQT